MQLLSDALTLDGGRTGLNWVLPRLLPSETSWSNNNI